MKKISLILFLFAGFFLVGCNYFEEKPEEPIEPIEIHEHSFNDEFEFDETKHWKSASCEHTELSKDLGSHLFDENNICTVCGYKKVKTPVTYTIVFVDEMNKETKNLVVEEGGFITPVDDPILAGYTFVGWVDKDNNLFGLKADEKWSSYKVGSDITLFASYTANLVNLKVNCDSFLGEFDINIDDEDYLSNYGGTVKVGSTIKLKAKVKEYANFNGWKSENTILSNELVYSFVVENKDYDITLNLIGKEYELSITEINCICTSKNNKYRAGDYVMVSSIAEIAGFVFDGYYDSDDRLLSTDQLYSFRMPGKDYNIVAKMFGNVHTITIHSTKEGYSSVIVPFQDDVIIEKRAGEKFILEPAQYRGYRCLGGNIDITMPENDLVYTFQYEPITYTISYNNIYGGEYIGDNKNSLPKTYTIDKTINLPNPSITSSYVFANFYWYLDSDCTGDFISGAIISGTYAEDLILYAKIEYWNDDRMMNCIVKYVDDGGNEVAPSVNLGKKRFNEVITGYNIPRLDSSIYTLKNNGYGSRMGLTDDNEVVVNVVYERKSCNITYVLMFPDGFNKPYSYGMASLFPENEPLKEFKVTSNEPLIIPKSSEYYNGVIYKSEGLYLDSDLTIPVTNVDPAWNSSIQLYVKMIPR